MKQFPFAHTLREYRVQDGTPKCTPDRTLRGETCPFHRFPPVLQATDSLGRNGDRIGAKRWKLETSSCERRNAPHTVSADPKQRGRKEYVGDISPTRRDEPAQATLASSAGQQVTCSSGRIQDGAV